MGKNAGLIIAGCFLLTLAAMSVRAEEPSSLCCNTTSDCKTPEYPQCNNVGADCDPVEFGDQSYCMKASE